MWRAVQCHRRTRGVHGRGAEGGLYTWRLTGRVLLESTGSYGLDLALELHAVKRFVVVYLNPAQSKAYAQAKKRRAKTDRLDAKLLAEMASKGLGHAWQPPEEAYLELRAMTRHRRSMVENRTREKNRLAAARATNTTPRAVLDSLQATIQWLSDQIEALNRIITAHCRAHPELQRRVTLLSTMDGIGPTTSAEIVGEIGCAPRDLTPRQLVAYAGLDPQVFQSGHLDARRHISRQGSRFLRLAMHFAATNGVKNSPRIRAIHQGLLDRGKPKMVAYVAIARRLLHVVHALLRTGERWDSSRFGRLPDEATAS